jgi:hypothetical protein
MDLPVMADSRMDALINAPCETIDLTAWVFGLTDKEYQACSKDHIAAAASLARDGKRMSINVERIGSLIVQHYVEDISERGHCCLRRSRVVLTLVSSWRKSFRRRRWQKSPVTGESTK